MRSTPQRAPLRLLASVLPLLLLAMAACSPAPAEPAFRPITQPVLAPGQPIPAPAGEIVLTISGAIGASNTPGERLIRLDMATLEGLGLIEYQVEDNQALRRPVTFQGVSLQSLVALAQPDPAAGVAVVTALDDYSITIPLSDFATWPVMLATRADGNYFALGEYGPTRIIYPYSSYAFDVGIYNPRWVWSVESIELRKP